MSDDESRGRKSELKWMWANAVMSTSLLLIVVYAAIITGSPDRAALGIVLLLGFSVLTWVRLHLRLKRDRSTGIPEDEQ